MEFISDALSTITMIVTVASLIAASTPTPIDDGAIKKLYRLIDLAAINVGKAKD